MFVRAQRDGDTTTVCGAWSVAAEYRVAERAAEIFMRDGRVVLGDTVLRNGLLFMRELKPGTAVETASGKCIDTGVPWREAFVDQKPRIQLEKWSL